MSYPFHSPSEQPSNGSTSMAFRVTAAVLAGAAVLLAFALWTDAGLGGVTAWLVAAAATGAVFMLAQALIVAIMIVVPPALIIAVLVRFLLS